jgi:hypothetical protein
MEYKAEDYIRFIETERADKLSPHGLSVIVKRYREMESALERIRKHEKYIIHDYYEFFWELVNIAKETISDGK